MSDVTFEDLTRAIDTRAPDFAGQVIALLNQPDPAEDRPEGADASQAYPPLPEGTWTLRKLKQALSGSQLADMTPTERKIRRREAFSGLLAAPYPPPRFKLGALLPPLYDPTDEWSHSQLMAIFKDGKLGLGVWQAFKAIYKRVEVTHDAAMFGVLAYRLDRFAHTPNTGEIGVGTRKYMRRRAWRYLRQLGGVLPELYPQFAAQVLRHYPRSATFYGAWIPNQVWAHEDLIGKDKAPFAGPPDDLRRRAFDEAWKLRPEPLLRLLEDADNEQVCDFAIRSLNEDFGPALRAVDVAWLRRIGRRRLATVDRFLVKLLNDNPELHQTRLRALGLHRTVLDLLQSPDAEAQTYAARYAEAFAPDIDVAELIELALSASNEGRKLAIARLTRLTPAEIGLARLIRLVKGNRDEQLAMNKLREGFKASALDQDSFVKLVGGRADRHRTFVEGWYENEQVAMPTRYLLAVVDAEDMDASARHWAFERLEARPGREIGMDWFKRALLEPRTYIWASGWLTQGKLTGDDLDVEWVKGLVPNPSHRSLALELLGDRNIVSPSRVGVPWLLAMARNPDASIHGFAHWFLLERITPDDFGGVDRLWALAAGPNEPEAIRRFAATYLKVHHPTLGPTLREAQRLGVEPRLAADAYGLDRVRPLFEDERPDVRNLAGAITRHELVRWDDRMLLYTLADSPFREARAVAAEILLAIGDVTADPAQVPPTQWLDARQIFALTESARRPTREIALQLIANHYDVIGGPQRLAWLMESPDREVRTFAVRLLWSRHRPRETAEAWTPKKGAGVPSATERFDSPSALYSFLRTVMFGLPPGRRPRQDAGQAFLSRPLPASVAKRRLVEVVRDQAVADDAFAKVVVPLLEEFLHSVGEGEWQACLTALVRIRRAHPHVSVALPPAIAGTRAPKEHR